MNKKGVEDIFREEIRKYMKNEMISYKINNCLLILPKHTDEVQKLVYSVIDEKERHKYDMSLFEICQSKLENGEGATFHMTIDNNKDHILSSDMDYLVNSHNKKTTNINDDVNLIINDGNKNEILQTLTSSPSTPSPSTSTFTLSPSSSLYLSPNLKQIQTLVCEYLSMLSKILTCKSDTLCWTHHNFIKTFSNQIKNPLNGLAVGIQVLEETSTSNYQKNIINYLIQSCVELTTYMNDIVDYYNLSQDKIKMDVVDFDIRENLMKIVELFKPQVAEKMLRLECSVSSTIPKNVYTDGKRLCQVLINLLKNSIANTHKGHISIDVQYHINENKLEFTILDTGIGILGDELENVFRPFYQIEKTGNNGDNGDNNMEGLGLGLAICKKIVNKLNGDIYFINENYENYQGTAIQFWIPITKTDAIIDDNTDDINLMNDTILKNDVDDVDDVKILIIDNYKNDADELKLLIQNVKKCNIDIISSLDYTMIDQILLGNYNHFFINYSNNNVSSIEILKRLDKYKKYIKLPEIHIMSNNINDKIFVELKDFHYIHILQKPIIINYIEKILKVIDIKKKPKETIV